MSSLGRLDADYFRARDFEYVQPLYDLAFLLEVEALGRRAEVPKYRTFSLWRAGYSLDGYGTTLDRWLDGAGSDESLDYVPSARIKQYLQHIRQQGTVAELANFGGERFDRCLRLRSVRGLGPSKIAATLSFESLDEEWCQSVSRETGVDADRIADLYQGGNQGPWQTAHIVPPLLRFLNRVERESKREIRWAITGISDPFEPVTNPVTVTASVSGLILRRAIERILESDRFFAPISDGSRGHIAIRHRLGWGVSIQVGPPEETGQSIFELASVLDPMSQRPVSLRSDLHLHTAWSDGSASVDVMAKAVVASGLEYFAVTDHSRSSKLQGGLSPLLWLRQANALTLAKPVCPILHGIEVDILKDGELDLPPSLLAATDFVVASVHSNWTKDARQNTNRLLRAIESGLVDVIGHPTSVVVGKPGVPDYYRPPADVIWSEVFEKCAQWKVALEINCFPSRLDLSQALVEEAVAAGCAISLGSDAHARSHLLNIRFGEAALAKHRPKLVLNRLSHEELTGWVAESRAKRQTIQKTASTFVQTVLDFDGEAAPPKILAATINPPKNIPDGSRVVGIDLTAGNKSTGIAYLDGFSVETCSLTTDDEIVDYVRSRKPEIVSIDSPLGLPGGGKVIDPSAGIVRVAEHDLSSIGIPAYPALIDSMKNLTLRGIRLKTMIEGLPHSPTVIESYPGAAQDILSIPRKQKSLELLREGLRRLGLGGPGLDTRSHDEMDAITSAIVGRYYESGLFEPMGIPSEAQLIVPKVSPIQFDLHPVICLTGKTGAGKSVVARYLSVFYGFRWIRTRSVIRELLVDDLKAPSSERICTWDVEQDAISERDLQDFGKLILDVYDQRPLRRKLTDMIRTVSGPIVVDAIRDVVDVEASSLGVRPVVIWSVESSDPLIRTRLTNRKKEGNKSAQGSSPVDRTAEKLSKEAHKVIPNFGSFEELRWSIDDSLFSSIRIQ